MLVIVDYGMGNLGSVKNMLRRIGIPSVISGAREEIAVADSLILPGVGAFDAGMRSLEERGLRGVLERKACEERVPLLGICLGAQLLTRSSEEGRLPGLGWVAASTRLFSFPGRPDLKVPHMGWNTARPCRPSPLTASLEEGARYYFVHSYYLTVEHEEDSILKTFHGIEFDSGIRSGNIYGVQFHPEKSHRFGMRVLESFARIKACSGPE